MKNSLATISTPDPDRSDDELEQLMNTIVARRDNPAARSYTQVLFAGGDELIGQKILEEAAEVVDAAKILTRCQSDQASIPRPSEADDKAKDKVNDELHGVRQHLIHEAADLVYHLWVMLAAHQISLHDLRTELARRTGVSGLEEKASRTR
jgi:phosphoribosyl-ATP pyrophosphohydrolase